MEANIDKKSIIQLYVQEYQKAGETSIQLEDDDDDGFGSAALEKWFMENQLRYDALTWWQMSPKNLVDIVDAVCGAEIYEFNHLYILGDLVELYKRVENTSKEPSNQDQGLSVEWLKAYLDNSVLEQAHTSTLNNLKDMAAEGHQEISFDVALGILIETRIAIEAVHNVIRPPGGDDTYFDYYPGAWRYQMAVMNWFLHDGPRMI